MKNTVSTFIALLASVAMLAIASGCNAQMPPATNHSVQLAWTAPSASSTWSGCSSSAPCTYAVYRCADTAANCASTTNASWKEITTAASRPSGTSYTDATAAGLTAYYAVETVQGSSNSAASNIAGPAAVPGTPIAPPLGNPTVAMEVKPALPVPDVADPVYAMARPLRLSVRVR